MNFYQFKLKLISDNPRLESLNKGIVYVVGNEAYIKWAYLKCPCGCQETIMLPLHKENFPSWRINRDKLGRVNISPSIHREDGCKSHFWITQGKVHWANY